MYHDNEHFVSHSVMFFMLFIEYDYSSTQLAITSIKSDQWMSFRSSE